MEKAAVFIDGAYLNRILKNNFNGLAIDYAKFCDFICESSDTKRLRTYYYNCLPIIRAGNKSDEQRHSGVQKFLGGLKRLPRFEIKLGKLQLIGGQFRQKMVDVLMSLDIVEMCFGRKIDQLILVAGDADFVPATKKAKDYGAVIHLFYQPSSAHNELLDEADELYEINDNLIANSKL